MLINYFWLLVFNRTTKFIYKQPVMVSLTNHDRIIKMVILRQAHDDYLVV